MHDHSDKIDKLVYESSKINVSVQDARWSENLYVSTQGLIHRSEYIDS